MRSLYFSRNAIKDNDKLERAVRGLAVLPIAALKQLLDLELALIAAHNESQRGGLLRSVAQRIGVIEIDVTKAVGAIERFSRVFVDPEFDGDDPNTLAADIAQAEIEVEHPDRVLPALAAIRERSEEFHRRRQEAAEPYRSLPGMTNLTMRVNYRPLFSREYAVYSDVDQYNPVCVGLVPVVTATLVVEGNDPQELSFAMNRDNVRALIAHLQAVEKQFRLADEYLRDTLRKDERQ
jgi:hypothetical protein